MDLQGRLKLTARFASSNILRGALSTANMETRKVGAVSGVKNAPSGTPSYANSPRSTDTAKTKNAHSRISRTPLVEIEIQRMLLENGKIETSRNKTAHALVQTAQVSNRQESGSGSHRTRPRSQLIEIEIEWTLLRLTKLTQMTNPRSLF